MYAINIRKRAIANMRKKEREKTAACLLHWSDIISVSALYTFRTMGQTCCHRRHSKNWMLMFVMSRASKWCAHFISSFSHSIAKPTEIKSKRGTCIPIQLTQRIKQTQPLSKHGCATLAHIYRKKNPKYFSISIIASLCRAYWRKNARRVVCVQIAAAFESMISRFSADFGEIIFCDESYSL